MSKFPDLAVVRLVKDIQTFITHEVIPAGTLGTIVHIYRDDTYYEVEFNNHTEAVHEDHLEWADNGGDTSIANPTRGTYQEYLNNRLKKRKDENRSWDKNF